MDVVFSVLMLAIVLYSVYELGGMIYAHYHPEEPYEAEDPVADKTVIVTRAFGSGLHSGSADGTVEMNGTEWQARTKSRDLAFVEGDLCRVVGRDGLTLLVDAKDGEG